MKQNSVFLSIGRHGRYGHNEPIEQSSMLEVYLLGKYLKENLPEVEAVYHSPIPRAVQTAKFRALGLGSSHLLCVPQLSEDSPKFFIQKFINGLVADSTDDIKHYHLITHLPVVEKLGLPDLGAGEVCICEAENWQEMLCENFSVSLLHNPPKDEYTAFLASLNISENALEKHPADEIYSAISAQNKKSPN